MKIYNTLSKKKEIFEPISDKKVHLFVCGPTVYDYSHIGHARTYIFYDVLVRYLRYKGYEVDYLQNITNIDDKIIERAMKSGINPPELADEFAKYYKEDMAALGINSVSKYAPATGYIPQVINQVKRLVEKGFAYLIENDGYYFDLSKFPEYGKLSGRKMEQAQDAVSRIDNSPNKKNKGDFALWKFSKVGEPSWDSTLGTGRPGWHIEDTAISEAEFGPQYDLHGGALELMFPHHEAEIAQMESVSGKKPMVKYWVHTGLLTIGGKKMAKSLGNFITIRDLMKDYSREVVRFMTLSSHYRSPIDYSDKLIKQSEAAIMRIGEFKNRLLRYDGGKTHISEQQKKHCLDLINNIFSALDDDLNIPMAFGHLFDAIRTFNGFIDDDIDLTEFSEISEIIDFFDKVVGVVPEKSIIPEEITKLVNRREISRKNLDFNEADKIRHQILNLGYLIEDTSYGPLVKKD